MTHKTNPDAAMQALAQIMMSIQHHVIKGEGKVGGRVGGDFVQCFVFLSYKFYRPIRIGLKFCQFLAKMYQEGQVS